MHTKPLIKPGARESEYWYLVKKIWCKVRYNDNHHKISKKEFFKNFLKYCEDVGGWNYKDKNGNLKYPTEEDYHYASNHVFKKYEWDNCAESYEESEMNDSFKRAIKIRKKGREKRTLKNMEHYDKLDVHEDKLIQEQKEGANHEYRIRAIEETKSSILLASDKELGLDETKFKIDGKVDAEIKQHITAEKKAEKLIELKEKMKGMTYD